MPHCLTPRDRVERLQEAVDRDLERYRKWKVSMSHTQEYLLKVDTVYGGLTRVKKVCQLWLDTYAIHRGNLRFLERLGYFQMYPCPGCPVTDGRVPEITLEVSIQGA